MKNLAVSILLFSSLIGTSWEAVIACDRPTFDQHRVTEALGKFEPAKIQLYLYSIDPLHRQDVIDDAPNFFHGFPILGEIEIKPLDEKKALLHSFAQGVKESIGEEANCFEPRHGLRVVQGDKETDFVICYSCLSVDAYGFGPIHGFLTSASPREVFNRLLDQYHIKKPDPEN